MSYLYRTFSISIIVFVTMQIIKENTGYPILENNDDMMTMALFDKLNWIIREMKSINKQFIDIKKSTQEQIRKSEVRELFEKQDLKTENLLIQLQDKVLESFEFQGNLLKSTTLDLQNLETIDAISLKHNRNWQTILRRQDGSQNFSRSWDDYKSGFGNVNGEFFIGLNSLHAMTTYADPQELLFVVQDFDNETRYAKYSDFVVGSETEGYKIQKLGKYKGDAGDSFSEHLNSKFTTYDRDNDNSTTTNCATMYEGGWWFHKCYHSCLTGPYFSQAKTINNNLGVAWNSWRGLGYSYKYAEMMIRPK